MKLKKNSIRKKIKNKKITTTTTKKG